MRAVERCNGIAECKTINNGLMCPSYMATREEKHTTRARANILRHILNNPPDVLVEAEDLLHDPTVIVDHAMREVTYVHILLERHNVIWANGLESESFHPSNTALDTVDPGQLGALLDILPGGEANPHSYGD